MDNTSILSERPIEGATTEYDEATHDTISLSPGKLDFQYEVASSLLLLIQTLQRNNRLRVPIDNRLESVQHLHTIGEGASFSVRQDFRNEPGTGKVVLKISRQGYSVGSNNVFRKHAVQTLMRELYVLGDQNFVDHPNIVKLRKFGWGVASILPFEIAPIIYIERAPHGTLVDLENSGIDLSFDAKVLLCDNVCDGLAALHASGIIHGDLKADNILIFGDQETGYSAKISDFGCAVFKDDHMNETEDATIRLPGVSPPWHAPESTEPVQVKYLEATDIFPLGFLIWRILVYRDPFSIFDLPLGRSVRLSMIEELLAVPTLPILVPSFMKEAGVRCSPQETVSLFRLFLSALSFDPSERDLTVVKTQLRNCVRNSMLQRESSETPEIEDINKSEDFSEPKVEQIAERKVRTNSRSGVDAVIDSENTDVSTGFTTNDPQTQDPICGPPQHLERVDLDMAAILRLPPDVQRQVFAALKTIHAQRESDEPTLDPQGQLACSCTWHVAVFQLRGIGCATDAKQALCTLGDASRRGDWKAMVTAKRLYEALGIYCPGFLDRECNPVDERFVGYEWGAPLGRSLKVPRSEILSKRHGLPSPEELVQRMRENKPCESESHQSLPSTGKNMMGEMGNNLMHAAAAYGRLNDVKNIYEQQLAAINGQNFYGETPLLLACRYGHVEIIDFLLDCDADASLSTLLGESPLYWLDSIADNEVDRIARRLFAHGSPLQCITGESEADPPAIIHDLFLLTAGHVYGSPMLRAIGNQDFISFEVLRQIIMNRLKGLDEHDTILTILLHTLLQPLQLASELHLYEFVESLLARAVDIVRGVENIEKRQFGSIWLPLIRSDTVTLKALDMTHYIERLCLHGPAWKEAMTRTIDILVSYGLIRPLLNTHGRLMPPLHYCIEAGNVALDHLLQNYSAEEELSSLERFPHTLIDTALDHDNLYALKAAIRAGATVNYERQLHPKHRLASTEASYLHVSALLRSPDFAQVLLDGGIPAGTVDKMGLSALDLAVCKGSFAVADLLISHGANPNSLGPYGYTVLGRLLEPAFQVQCADHIASIKRVILDIYLLEIKDPSARPNFIVRPETGVTALIIASSNMSPDPRMPELFRLLLQHFGNPDEVNCRATTESRSTPLQAAITGHNVPAVKALLKAGADVSIIDSRDQTTLDLAIAQLQSLIYTNSDLSRRDIETDVARALEIISLISEAGSWPKQFDWGVQITAMLQVATPLMEVMMELPHWKNMSLGLEQSLASIIAQYNLHIPTQDIRENVEYRRQLHSAIQPLFYAELAFRMTPSKRQVLNRAGSKAGSSYHFIKSKLKILSNLTLERLVELQQAALFEYCLDQMRDLGLAGESCPDGWLAFKEYAETGNREKLPIDARFIVYPETLLEWWQWARSQDLLNIEEPADEVMADSFIEILQRRATAQAEGETRLPALDTVFRDFHFNKIHNYDKQLNLTDIQSGILTVWACRCMQSKHMIGDLAIEVISYMDECIQAEESFVFHGDVNLVQYFKKKLHENIARGSAGEGQVSSNIAEDDSDAGPEEAQGTAQSFTESAQLPIRMKENASENVS
ncbi:hypothetical protein MMC26_001413 [Xylographa opegraphella]|nr:hypothetical protein [Xylographa opegraphella]